MAQPTTLSGTQLYIKIGDGALPEVFAQPCLINTDRGITFTQNGNKVAVPDCDNPDDPAWNEFVAQSVEAAISGAGVMDNVETTVDAYTTWATTKMTKNVQVWLGTIGYWSGAFVLTSFGVTGARGDKIQCTLSLESSGVVAWNAGT